MPCHVLYYTVMSWAELHSVILFNLIRWIICFAPSPNSSLLTYVTILTSMSAYDYNSLWSSFLPLSLYVCVLVHTSLYMRMSFLQACVSIASSNIISLLYQLWREKSEDAEIILQLIHCFYKCVCVCVYHSNTNIPLLNDSYVPQSQNLPFLFLFLDHIFFSNFLMSIGLLSFSHTVTDSHYLHLHTVLRFHPFSSLFPPLLLFSSLSLRLFQCESSREEAMFGTRIVVDIIECLSHKNIHIKRAADRATELGMQIKSNQTFHFYLLPFPFLSSFPSFFVIYQVITCICNLHYYCNRSLITMSC